PAGPLPAPRLPPALSAPAGPPSLVLLPGAGKPANRPLPEVLAAVADRCAQVRPELEVLLVGGPSDRPLAAEVVRRCRVARPRHRPAPPRPGARPPGAGAVRPRRPRPHGTRRRARPRRGRGPPGRGGLRPVLRPPLPAPRPSPGVPRGARSGRRGRRGGDAAGRTLIRRSSGSAARSAGGRARTSPPPGRTAP